jgi:hypothetical protein
MPGPAYLVCYGQIGGAGCRLEHSTFSALDWPPTDSPSGPPPGAPPPSRRHSMRLGAIRVQTGRFGFRAGW